ncbi:MAG: hypothetical protein ACI35O_06215 [Bacillaceae bacterium]
MKKTDLMVKGLVTAVLGLSLTACSSQKPANVSKDVYPDDEECDDWEWDDELGVYGCDDSNSSRYGSYYYGGRYYDSKSALKADSKYQTYRSTGINKDVPKKLSTSKSSGFGSGVKSTFGG